jgi:hypothetical protein
MSATGPYTLIQSDYIDLWNGQTAIGIKKFAVMVIDTCAGLTPHTNDHAAMSIRFYDITAGFTYSKCEDVVEST